MIERGEIWDAELGEHGARPCVVPTRDSAIPVLARVNVVLVTRTLRGHVAEVELGREHGLAGACAANCDVVLNVRKSDLTRLRGRLDPVALRRFDDALRVAQALD